MSELAEELEALREDESTVFERFVSTLSGYNISHVSAGALTL